MNSVALLNVSEVTDRDDDPGYENLLGNFQALLALRIESGERTQQDA